MPNSAVIFNLSIIIPALAGMYLFRSLTKEYKFFTISILAGAMNEFNAEFKIVNTQSVEFFYSILYTQIVLLIYFKWDTEKISIYKKTVTHFCVFTLIAIDQYYDYLSIYHIKWALITCMVGISFYGIRLLTQSQNNLISTKESLSRRLIIIPFMVFSVYYAAINILMHFLYNADTRLIFMDLYNVIRWINFLSYISYTLALLWAPKKEKFL